jgi:HdeA/HdeB family
MNKMFALIAAVLLSSISTASAQVELKTYADANGYIDVQKLTCAQLANTFQEDADFLTVWYSGWYNGLGKKHMMKVDRAKTLEHEVIVHCKANPGKKVIQAIDVVFKTYRAEQGIKVR